MSIDVFHKDTRANDWALFLPVALLSAVAGAALVLGVLFLSGKDQLSFEARYVPALQQLR